MPITKEDRMIERVRKVVNRRKRLWDEAVKKVAQAIDAAEKAQGDWMEANQALIKAIVRRDATKGEPK